MTGEYDAQSEACEAHALPLHFGAQCNVRRRRCRLCNMCNSAVRFIARRDPKKNLLFCSVQSPHAEPLLSGWAASGTPFTGLHPWPGGGPQGRAATTWQALLVVVRSEAPVWRLAWDRMQV
jgi:predicted DCC family thiol-disulfide oxidoreductase YuxK